MAEWVKIQYKNKSDGQWKDAGRSGDFSNKTGFYLNQELKARKGQSYFGGAVRAVNKAGHTVDMAME